jgi:hypothetical protein
MYDKLDPKGNINLLSQLNGDATTVHHYHYINILPRLSSKKEIRLLGNIMECLGQL